MNPAFVEADSAVNLSAMGLYQWMFLPMTCTFPSRVVSHLPSLRQSSLKVSCLELEKIIGDIWSPLNQTTIKSISPKTSICDNDNELILQKSSGNKKLLTIPPALLIFLQVVYSFFCFSGHFWWYLRGIHRHYKTTPKTTLPNFKGIFLDGPLSTNVPRHGKSLVFMDYSKKIATHPQSTPQAIPLANYERNTFIAGW